MNELDSSQLSYRIDKFPVNGKARFVMLDRETLRPSIATSIYENSLTSKTESNQGVASELSRINYFLTWAKKYGYDFENALCHGQAIQQRDINAFSAWLSKRGTKRDEKLRKLESKFYNQILQSVSSMFSDFIRLYSEDAGIEKNLIEKSLLINASKDIFKSRNKKIRAKDAAPDLSEKEIAKIETYLRPDDIEKASANKLRDYIIWRMAIEFGLRIGEILALRVEDCPVRRDQTIKIVRIEERGDDYLDPRAPNAPRPKTLSRKLGFIFKNSPLKLCINEYITKHRYRVVEKFGKQKKELIIEGPNLLLLNHKDNDGMPLSSSRAKEIAKEIRKNTGIKFHWHLARHSFFNRAYASIVDRDNYNALKTDLITWGGWQNPDSLQIYINRAKQHRAEVALCFWQENNLWKALQ